MEKQSIQFIFNFIIFPFYQMEDDTFPHMILRIPNARDNDD